MKRNQTIQANVSLDFKNEFNDLYNESGANSKGEFLRGLVDNYLNPETIEKSKQTDLDRISELELQVEQLSSESVAINELQEQVDLLTTENQQLKNRPPVTKEVPIELGDNQIIIDLNPVQKALLTRIVNDEVILKNYIRNEERESSDAYKKFIKKCEYNLISLFDNENDPKNKGKLLINTFFLILIIGGSRYILEDLRLPESEIKDIIRENDEDYALSDQEKSAWDKFWES